MRIRLTDVLGVRYPILLAPMDVVSDARLTAAVSAAGGLGLLGGGYGNAEWLKAQLDALHASKQRFGVGFITWSLAKQPALLDMALERAPAAVMLSFGDPRLFLARIKRTGATAICQVQNVKDAVEAVDAGADVLVAQGTEGGGHGGSRGLFTLLPEIVGSVSPSIPVVAAGGIADGRGLAAALVLGAAGVLLGTRFYASAEAAGAAAAKARICAATGDDTVRGILFDLVRRNVWPSPFTGRCLRNDLTRRWLGREVELLQSAELEGALYLAAQAAQDFDRAAVIAGEGAGLINEVLPVEAIVQRLVTQARPLLADSSALDAALRA